MEEELDTSGFYSKDGENLLHAPNFVLGPFQRFELRRENKNEYNYPVEGWYWFSSETEAKKFF